VSFDLRVQVELALHGQSRWVLRLFESLLLVVEAIAAFLVQLEKALVVAARLLNKCRMHLRRQNNPSTYCPMKAVHCLPPISTLQLLVWCPSWLSLVAREVPQTPLEATLKVAAAAAVQRSQRVV
jgi:hypothetical protein